MPQWSIAESFIKLGLKLRKFWRWGGGGGGESLTEATLDWATSKKLGLDRVKVLLRLIKQAS